MTDKFDQFDVVIVGGGVAGMAAAMWCDELGLSECMIDRATDFGGQLRWIHNPITNYPPATFKNGAELLGRFQESLADRHFKRMPNTPVTSIDHHKTSVVLGNGQTILAAAIILATGVRRRTLGVPGEGEFAGKGILESGSRDRADATGRSVAVIGGGDAALENALILGEYADKVYLIHRGDRFSARQEFVERVERHDRIECIFNSHVREFSGSSALEFVVVEREGIGTDRIAIEIAVVRVGVEPNSELISDAADTDEAGYVKVDAAGRSSLIGIYAIGDVAFPISPTIATAVGSAATAVKSIAAEIRRNE